MMESAVNSSFVHIGPDHYLDLENADAISKADVLAAWERAYTDLERELAGKASVATLYVVFGIQGSGKSTWIRENAARVGHAAIFFDGPLPSSAKRARALELAARHGVKTVAVWLNTPLEIAMRRNAGRKGLAVIKTEAILHVHNALEAPTLEEGFAEVIVVDGNAA